MSEDEKDESPNKALDKALKSLLKDSADTKVDELLFERRRKAIATAIQWEKVRHAINEKDDSFNADDL